MILSDRDLLAALNSGHLKIEGWSGKVGPASIDVHLLDEMTLEPGEFMLGSTSEIVSVPDDMAAQVHGCSTVGRQGIFVQNAGWVDAGFQGQITLEIISFGTHGIHLPPGFRIAQLSFSLLTSPAERPYGSPGVGRYQGQRGATPARPELG